MHILLHLPHIPQFIPKSAPLFYILDVSFVFFTEVGATVVKLLLYWATDHMSLKESLLRSASLDSIARISSWTYSYIYFSAFLNRGFQVSKMVFNFLRLKMILHYHYFCLKSPLQLGVVLVGPLKIKCPSFQAL